MVNWYPVEVWENPRYNYEYHLVDVEATKKSIRCRKPGVNVRGLSYEPFSIRGRLIRARDNMAVENAQVKITGLGFPVDTMKPLRPFPKLITDQDGRFEVTAHLAFGDHLGLKKGTKSLSIGPCVLVYRKWRRPYFQIYKAWLRGFTAVFKQPDATIPVSIIEESKPDILEEPTGLIAWLRKLLGI